MSKELEKGLKDKFKNPYGEYKIHLIIKGYTRAGWGKDSLGYTKLKQQRITTGNARLVIHMFKQMCWGLVEQLII